MEDFTSCMWCHRAVVVRGCVAAGTVHAQVMSTIRVMSTVTCVIHRVLQEQACLRRHDCAERRTHQRFTNILFCITKQAI